MRALCRVSLALAAAVTLLLLHAGCKDDRTAPLTPGSITASPASVIAGIVGQSVPVSVTVLGEGGDAYAGGTVAFTVVSGGGSVSPSSVTTDGSGRASTSWLLGTIPGMQELSASLGGLSAGFVAEAQAGPPASLQALNAYPGSYEAGSQLQEPAVFQAKDRFGNKVSGAPVSFSASHGGSVSPAQTTTDTQGSASTTWTLGLEGATQTLTATVASIAQATITVEAEAVTGGTSYVSILSWGGNGTLDGKFAEAGGLALDPQGNVWVADLKNENIQEFDSSGDFLKKFQTTIETAATYDGPTHIGFTDSGDLYALSSWGYWVARYDPAGVEEFLGSPRYGYASILDFAVDPRNGDFFVVFVGAIGKFGGGGVLWQKTLNDLESVTVDSQGNVYVTAYPGIQKYDPTGNLAAELDTGGASGTLAVDALDRLYFLSEEVIDRYLNVYDGNLNLLDSFEIDANCWSYECSFAVDGEGEHLFISFHDLAGMGDFHNTIHKYERR